MPARTEHNITANIVDGCADETYTAS